MRPRTLLVLAVLTVLGASGAWLALRTDGQRAGPGRVDRAPFADLLDEGESLQRVRLLTAGGEINLERSEGRWRVREKHAYPADTGRLSDLLAGLVGLRLLEPRTDDPARYGALDLTEPEQGGRALRVEVYGAPKAPLAALLVGKPRNVRGGGVRQLYVRLPGAAETWLAEGPLDPPRDASLWLARQVVDIPQAQIRRIRVALAGQEPYTLERPGEDAPFTLDPLPPGRTLAAQRAGAAAFGLQDLTLQNVFLPEEVDADWAEADVVTFTTADGIEIELRVVRLRGVPNARLRARAGEGAVPEARQKAEALADRTEPWVYVLAPHPVSTFTAARDTLLEPAEEDAEFGDEAGR